MCFCACTCACPCPFAYACVYSCACSVCMCVRACACVHVIAQVCVCICTRVRKFVLACVFVCLFVGLVIGERVCLHACAYVCACMFVCRNMCCSQRLSGTLVQLSRSRALSLSCMFKSLIKETIFCKRTLSFFLTYHLCAFFILHVQVRSCVYRQIHMYVYVYTCMDTHIA